jgi:hypothetical protein
MISETFYTCPRCRSHGFSAMALAEHVCDGVDPYSKQGQAQSKRRLTGPEYLAAMSQGIAKKYTSR